MNEKEAIRRCRLEKAYLRAQSICNPIEYSYRQQNLLEAIALFLLDPNSTLEQADEEQG